MFIKIDDPTRCGKVSRQMTNETAAHVNDSILALLETCIWSHISANADRKKRER